MTLILNRLQISEVLADIDAISEIEHGFKEYSKGNCVVPPVGELLFDNPKGDVHIKYGYIKDDDFYVVKIASGFYENSILGIPTSQGLMLLFNQKTGQLESILLDEGFLTDVRTAVAGAIAAKYFAPKKLDAIGIIGTGIQAKYQLEYLEQVTDCKTVWIWGRNSDHVRQFNLAIKNGPWILNIADSPNKVAKHCQLIVTTTPAEEPLLFARDIMLGTHITAVGSDTSDKQELDSQILKNADIVISDSLSQSKTRGEIYKARENNLITDHHIVELGIALQHSKYQRQNDDQTTVVDLTGVAVQDIMISKAVYKSYIQQTKS